MDPWGWVQWSHIVPITGRNMRPLYYKVRLAKLGIVGSEFAKRAKLLTPDLASAKNTRI